MIILSIFPRSDIQQFLNNNMTYFYLPNFHDKLVELGQNEDTLYVLFTDYDMEYIYGHISVDRIYYGESDYLWLYTGKLSGINKQYYDTMFIDPMSIACCCMVKNIVMYKHPREISAREKHALDFARGFSDVPQSIISRLGELKKIKYSQSLRELKKRYIDIRDAYY